MGVQVTEAAAAHIERHLQQRGKGLGIRLGVKTTGCSGMSYVLEFVDSEAEEDFCYEEQGVRVYIDPKSHVYLDGTQLDFTKDGLNEGFLFKNPNAKSECGCGESFHI
ncbi:MAG: iron-sulfur cluster assembly protein IscA [Pseudomonadales bacterium]